MPSIIVWQVSFQPEIGFTSAPSYQGLLRMMTAEEAAAFPSRGSGPHDARSSAACAASSGEAARAAGANNRSTGGTYLFHNFLSWCTVNGSGPSADYDHV